MDNPTAETNQEVEVQFSGIETAWDYILKASLGNMTARKQNNNNNKKRKNQHCNLWIPLDLNRADLY